MAAEPSAELPTEASLLLDDGTSQEKQPLAGDDEGKQDETSADTEAPSDKEEKQDPAEAIQEFLLLPCSQPPTQEVAVPISVLAGVCLVAGIVLTAAIPIKMHGANVGPFFGFGCIVGGCLFTCILVAWIASANLNNSKPWAVAVVLWVLLSLLLSILLLSGVMSTGGNRGIDQFWGAAFLAMAVGICIVFGTYFAYSKTKDCRAVLAAVYLISCCQILLGCLFLTKAITMENMFANMGSSTMMGIASIVPGCIFFILATACLWYHYIRVDPHSD